MDYEFRQAEMSDVKEVFLLIADRVEWMNEKGIRQWNDTDYLNVYPMSYYEDHQRNGNLYLMKQDGRIVSAAVLLKDDPRWPNTGDVPAYYVHNFATDRTIRGLGSIMLEEIEQLAAEQGKTAVRLDCDIENVFLNEYYEKRGYEYTGTCIDGPYIGNRREKRIGQKAAVR